jgi:hypothetical protein
MDNENTGHIGENMSHNHSRSALMDVIGTLDLPAGLPAGKIYETIEPYLVDGPADAPSLETLLVSTAEGTTASVATSKFSNLKFRLKDLLLEALKTTVKVQSSKNNGLALALVVLEFLQKAAGMMEYRLSTDDATILLEMYTLENEKGKINLEQLFASLKPALTETQILQSLDLLEKLSCIKYDLDQINLVETIVFTQE